MNPDWQTNDELMFTLLILCMLILCRKGKINFN